MAGIKWSKRKELLKTIAAEREEGALEEANMYGFFLRSCRERRVYHVLMAFYHQQLRSPPWRGRVEVVGQDDMGRDIISGTHIMNPGNPRGIREVNQRFGVDLPGDVDAFYRQWDGGLVLLRQGYPVLSAEQVIETSLNMRRWRGESLGTPWNVLRFCDLGDGDYLVFRRCGEGKWDIALALVDALDADIVGNNRLTVAPSFHAWLRRMIETDGYPLGLKPPVSPYDDTPQADRVR